MRTHNAHVRARVCARAHALIHARTYTPIHTRMRARTNARAHARTNDCRPRISRTWHYSMAGGTSRSVDIVQRGGWSRPLSARRQYGGSEIDNSVEIAQLCPERTWREKRAPQREESRRLVTVAEDVERSDIRHDFTARPRGSGENLITHSLRRRPRHAGCNADVRSEHRRQHQREKRRTTRAERVGFDAHDAHATDCTCRHPRRYRHGAR